MTKCPNCGNLNADRTNFCRFCGTKMQGVRPMPGTPAADDSPFGHPAPPRPYGWKTDEYQTQNEPSRSRQTGHVQTPTKGFDIPAYQPAPLANVNAQFLNQPYHCPHCMSQLLPQIERRISTAGWITFAVLMVFFFPLFWIGLLIKEDVRTCPNCLSRVG